MLGGPGSFPGYELGELSVTDYWTASGSYLWKFKDIMSIRGEALYAGVRRGGAGIRSPRATSVLPNFDDSEMIYGGSLYVTAHASGPRDSGHRRHQHGFMEPLDRRRPAGRARILERAAFSVERERRHSAEGAAESFHRPGPDGPAVLAGSRHHGAARHVLTVVFVTNTGRSAWFVGVMLPSST